MWSNAEIKERLQLWLDAEKAIAKGQAYQIGSRRLERANLHQVREQIKFWRTELDRVEGRKKRRVTRIVPRDL